MANRTIHQVIRNIVENIPPPPAKKCGKYLQDAIADKLNALPEFSAQKEDAVQFLRARMPVWRRKEDNIIEQTVKRRKIDIVIYAETLPIALVEIESDLDDLQMSGVSTRNGHYDVFSIAQSTSGQYFHSYKSIERMAAAAFYFQLQKRGRNYSEAEFAEFSLECLKSIKSDSPADHNPAGLPIFLVTGNCRNVSANRKISDLDILRPRLDSLGAELLIANS